MKTALLLASLLTTSIFAGELTAPRIRLNLQKHENEFVAGGTFYEKVYSRKFSTCAYRTYISYYGRRICRSGYVNDHRLERRFSPDYYVKRTVLNLSSKNSVDENPILQFMLNENPENCLINSMDSISDFAQENEIKQNIADLKKSLEVEEVLLALNYVVTPEDTKRRSPISLQRSIDIMVLDQAGNGIVAETIRLADEEYLPSRCNEGINEDDLKRLKVKIIEIERENRAKNEREDQADDLFEDFSELEIEHIIRQA